MATMTDLITMGFDTKTQQPVTITPADMTRGSYFIGKDKNGTIRGILTDRGG